MGKNQGIQEKSFAFAIRIVRLCRMMQTDKKEYILSKQLVRSGTSIGANIVEAQQAQSRADFKSKLNIALKEAVETEYWLRLMHATDYLTDAEYASIYNDCDELVCILVSSIQTLNK